MRPVAGVAGDGELLVAGGAGDAGGPWAGLFSLLMEHGAGERDLELGFPAGTFSLPSVQLQLQLGPWDPTFDH